MESLNIWTEVNLGWEWLFYGGGQIQHRDPKLIDYIKSLEAEPIPSDIDYLSSISLKTVENIVYCSLLNSEKIKSLSDWALKQGICRPMGTSVTFFEEEIGYLFGNIWSCFGDCNSPPELQDIRWIVAVSR